MNEVQFLRREVAAQRRAVREIVAPSASHKASHSETYDEYLIFILDLERLRLRAHLERLRTEAALTDADRATLERASGALSSVSALLGSPTAAVQDIAPLLMNHVLPLAEALDALAEPRYQVVDWRRVAQVDADSIAEERRLRQRVLEHAGSSSRR